MSSTTQRLYSAACASFADWCDQNVIDSPPSAHDIARYLAHVETTRGPTAVPVHLSAIGLLYRENGEPLDTRQQVIQEILQNARRKTKQRPVLTGAQSAKVQAAIANQLKNWGIVAAERKAKLLTDMIRKQIARPKKQAKES